jgi:hypothetical protein
MELQDRAIPVEQDILAHHMLPAVVAEQVVAV